MPERARRILYEKFQAHTDEAIGTILEIMRNDEANDSDRLAAAKELLNRGWGQAPNVNIVDATLKVEHNFNSDRLKQMTPEELAAFEGLLARVVGEDENESAKHALIDAEVVDTPNESAGHAPEPLRRRQRRD